MEREDFIRRNYEASRRIDFVWRSLSRVLKAIELEGHLNHTVNDSLKAARKHLLFAAEVQASLERRKNQPLVLT